MKKLLVVFSVLFSLVGLGCDLNTDYFKDYQNRNLIEDFPLTSTDWTTLNILLGVDPYVNFEIDPLYFGPSGLPAYRLEVRNLYPNGDFEAGTLALWDLSQLGASTFTLRDVTNPTFAADFPPGSEIGGNQVLEVDLATNTSAFFTLDDLDLLLVTPSAGTYNILFDYRTADSLRYGVLNQEASPEWEVEGHFNLSTQVPTPDPYDILYQIPDELVIEFQVTDPSLNRFHLGLDDSVKLPSFLGAQSSLVDNLRIIRKDDGVRLYAELKIQDQNSTSVKLIPGLYQLSFYVMDDPTVGSNNRFLSQGLWVNVIAKEKGALGNSQETNVLVGAGQGFMSRPALGWPGWTEVTTPQFNIDFEELPIPADEFILTIQVSPIRLGSGDLSFWDSASILIADPQLYFQER